MEPPFEPEEGPRSIRSIVALALTGFLIGSVVIVAAAVLVVRARFQALGSLAATPECRPSTLVLGETTFQIQILPLGSGGLASLPVDTPGVAYWVDGTQAEPVFVLSPAPENLAVVSTIRLGSEATATWSDCTATSYRISAHEPGSFQSSQLPDQAQKGMTIYFPIDVSGAGFVFRAEVPEQPAPPVANTSPTAVGNAAPANPVTTMPVIPTPDCGEPALTIGSTTFKVRNITAAADGSLRVPADTPGIAYWIEGTETNYVFVLSPLPQNLAVMDTITVGSAATATWPDCSSTSYTLSAPKGGAFDSSGLPDQSQEGVTIFFQTDPSGASFVFQGELAEEVITSIDTPMPDESGVLAEIGLLEVTTAPDGGTIKISVSIRNYGETAFTLSPEDASLTQPDGKTLPLAGSKPGLPRDVFPGDTETIDLIFPRPSTPTATLKIFTVEYDIDGY